MFIRDNTARAKQIVSIFWIMLGISIINLGSLAWQYILVKDAQEHPANIDLDTLRNSDFLRVIINSVNFIVLILSMVFFIMWFRRAYYNLHELPWHNARYTEGWAAGSWFIPIISLYWPYQIMIDIWRGTQNAIRERFGEPQPSTLVGWWWALFITNNFFAYIVAFANRDNNDLDGLILGTKIEFFGEFITIAAIIVAIRMIQQTSNFEKELLVHSQTPSDSIFSDNYNPSAETTEPKLDN